MTLVYSYIRFSSKKQIDGDSYRRQFEQADNWIKDREGKGFKLAPLKLHDLGVSAFRGKNRDTGALSKFVDEAKAGKIPAGSVLLVEHLDRLSRQGVAEAFEMFLGILRCNIKIVVLRPSEMEFTKASINDLVGLLMPLVYFHLAHVESENKSFRIKKAWQAKRSKLNEGEAFNKKCPAWLKHDGTKFVITEGAKAIKFIFEQCADGVGQKKILKALVKDFAPIGRVGRWNCSYIQKVLNDHSVLGEYRPRTMNEVGKFVPTGDVIAGYYPRVISDELWYRASASKAKRKKLKGRDGQYINIFKGIIFNAHDGYAMHLQTTRAERTAGKYIQRRLVSYGHLRNLPKSDSVSVPYDQFERLALTYLTELTLDEVKEDDTSAKILANKEKELAGINGRISEMQEALAEAGNIKSVMAVLAKLEEKQSTLRQEIELLRGIKQGVQPLHDAKLVIEQLKTIKEGEEKPLLLLRDKELSKDVINKKLNEASESEAMTLRLRLQGLIRDLVESVYVKPEKHFGRVYCFAQFNLRNGTFKQINFGRGFRGGSLWADKDISWNVDLRKRPTEPMFKPVAKMLGEPSAMKIPDKVPKQLGDASRVWLAIARNSMAKASYRVVPPKIKRFVDYMGDDLHCKQLNKARWEKWTAAQQADVRDGKQESGTARIIWCRSREFVRWLIKKGVVSQIENLEQSALKLFGG